jgi:ribosome-associated protein
LRPPNAGLGAGQDGIVVPGPKPFLLPERELRWRFSRSSGPGGQGVNTTDSRVELSVDLAGSPSIPDSVRGRLLHRLATRLTNGQLTVVAAEHRSQLRNREAARDRLAALLTASVAQDPPARRPTTPSKRARQRRMDDKARRGRIKRLRGRPDD